MQLTKEAIAEFKEIYEKEFNETITDSEAEEIGLRVIRVFRLLRSPLHSESTDTEEDTSLIHNSPSDTSPFPNTPSSSITSDSSNNTQSSNIPKPPPPLTEKEQSALHFITTYQRLHHTLPSTRVLAEHLGYRSSRSGYVMLKKLKELGVLPIHKEQ